MKILVCTDGSEQSQKALEEASKIAEGCNPDEVSIIHVYEHNTVLSSMPRGQEYSITKEDMDYFRDLQEKHKEESKKILVEALKIFEEKNIKASTIFKEGHPAETIIRVASEKGFDMIVIGSRGLSSLKQLFLGSVCNAVAQGANANVLAVK